MNEMNVLRFLKQILHLKLNNANFLFKNSTRQNNGQEVCHCNFHAYYFKRAAVVTLYYRAGSYLPASHNLDPDSILGHYI